MAVKRHEGEVLVEEGLVRQLLRAQFPQWADLPLQLVEPSGTDHTIFRVGDELVARFPAVEYATKQVIREARWVPFLAAQVPLELSVPIVLGESGEGYPWAWSIVRWIDGERATRENLDLVPAAVDLARFIRALHGCDASAGPAAGQTTSFRGLPLSVWDGRLDEWIAKLDGFERLPEVLAAWEEARAAPPWDRPPVWLHGDLTGNLIARDGRLVGVIDSGFAVGDPACDLMPGWSLFRGEDRRRFFEEVGLDEATILRARGWTIAPALIGLSYYRDVPHLHENARSAIEGALAGPDVS